MKKIINGKAYNTNTAKELGLWSNNRTDFSWARETLYQKRTGEFFVHGEGGPMTGYARTIGTNEWTGGERITPVTLAQARKWAETRLPADEYEEIFGEIVEDDTRSALTLSLPNSLLDQLRAGATAGGLSLSAYIEQRLA